MIRRLRELAVDVVELYAIVVLVDELDGAVARELGRLLELLVDDVDDDPGPAPAGTAGAELGDDELFERIGDLIACDPRLRWREVPDITVDELIQASRWAERYR